MKRAKLNSKRNLSSRVPHSASKKNDVIRSSPTAYVIVDSDGNKNPITIDGWPEQSTEYLHVTEAAPAVPEHFTKDKETKEKTVHPRNPGEVKFIHNRDGEEATKVMSQDEFVRFLIEGES